LLTSPVAATGLCKDAADWASKQRVNTTLVTQRLVPKCPAAQTSPHLQLTAKDIYIKKHKPQSREARLWLDL